MIEQKALAYANMYGILGTLVKLCEIDEQAIGILKALKKDVSLCFSIKGDISRTFHFSKNGCEITEGSDGCNCKMNFNSYESFNRLINDGKPGLPTKGIVTLLSFLLGDFTKLTNRLTELLRPTEENLKNSDFYKESTILTMYTVAGAVAGLANSDSIAKISAENTVDGDVLLGIKETAYATIRVKEHRFSVIYKETENPRAVMEFSDIALANGLFAGTVSTINEMCKGNIVIKGMISMIDNINRILDRVSVYLA